VGASTCVDFKDIRIIEFGKLSECLEVDVVGGIDSLGHPEDAVGYGNSASEKRVVFDIIHPTPVSITTQSVRECVQ
jgi:hypothetical protein